MASHQGLSREDLLALDGRLVVDRPYDERRSRLEHLAALAEGRLHVLPAFPGPDLDVVLASCEALAAEGVVAKRRSSRYQSKRSNSWRNMKCVGFSEHRARRFDRLS